MNKNQIEGTIKKTTGKIQQKLGEAIGSDSQELAGAEKRIEGTLQKGAGDLEQAGKDAAKKARNKP